jgi:hypothetical protein
LDNDGNPNNEGADMRRLVSFALCAGVMVTMDATQAAKLPALDKTWTDNCVSLRKASKNLPATVRNYCVCMQELIGAGEKFETVTEMERMYPPAHRSCWRKAGMRAG